MREAYGGCDATSKSFESGVPDLVHGDQRTRSSGLYVEALRRHDRGGRSAQPVLANVGFVADTIEATRPQTADHAARSCTREPTNKSSSRPAIRRCDPSAVFTDRCLHVPDGELLPEARLRNFNDNRKMCPRPARGSSRACAETACGLRERRVGGASRAVPEGARPCPRSGYREEDGSGGFARRYSVVASAVENAAGSSISSSGRWGCRSTVTPPCQDKYSRNRRHSACFASAKCAGSIVVIRNAEMGRTVPCSAVQAPNLDATIRTGEAVGTIPPLLELRLAPRFVRRRVKGLGRSRGRVESEGMASSDRTENPRERAGMGAESSWGRHAKWLMLVVSAATTAPSRDRACTCNRFIRKNEPIALVRFNNPTGHRFWMTEESRDASASAGPRPSSPCRRSPQYAAVLPAILGANPVRGVAVVRN